MELRECPFVRGEAMTDNEMIKALDMQCVHLRREKAELEQKLEMAKADRRKLMGDAACLSHMVNEADWRILSRWPRYGDGEPVWFGDELDFGGDVQQVQEFRFMGDSIAIADEFDCEEFFEIGEKVKRPAQDSWTQLFHDTCGDVDATCEPDLASFISRAERLAGVD